MLKWHPNKVEIYTADLCLKRLGISRDIRSCIKFYLFDKFCKTDIFFQSFGVKWSEEQSKFYELFQNHRVNFVRSNLQHGKTFFVDHLAAACCQANLKTLVVANGQRIKHLRQKEINKIDLEGFSENVLRTVAINDFKRLCFDPDIVIIDSYEHLDFLELLELIKTFINQKHVHIFATRCSTLSDNDLILEELYKHYKNEIHVTNCTVQQQQQNAPVWPSNERLKRLKELYADYEENPVLHLFGFQEE